VLIFVLLLLLLNPGALTPAGDGAVLRQALTVILVIILVVVLLEVTGTYRLPGRL